MIVRMPSKLSSRAERFLLYVLRTAWRSMTIKVPVAVVVGGPCIVGPETIFILPFLSTWALSKKSSLLSANVSGSNLFNASLGDILKLKYDFEIWIRSPSVLHNVGNGLLNPPLLPQNNNQATLWQIYYAITRDLIFYHSPLLLAIF